MTLKQEKIKSYGMGIMLSSVKGQYMRKFHNEIPVALDNGAFSSYKHGYGFNEYRFLKTLSDCIEAKLKLDFIVCPDIVEGGIESLNFSEMWRQRLVGHKLYLVVQDGMEILDVSGLEQNYKGIFVGGSKEWKWKTAHEWVNFAHDNGLPCHIGQCGTVDKIDYAISIGADSVDSTSIVRNDRFDIIENIGKQLSIK